MSAVLLMSPERKSTPYARVEELEWQLLEQSSVVAGLIVASSGRLLAANSLVSKLLRIGATGDLRGRSLSELLVDPADWTAWAEVARGRSGANMTLCLRRSDDERVVLRGDVIAIPDAGEHRLLGLFVDATEQDRLRDVMQRSARLEALGSLSSGVAHDFNNLLTVLVGNLSLIAEDLRDEPERFAKLKTAREAAKRGADLIRQLLAFARPQAIEMDTIRPAKIVANLAALLGRALGARVKLETDIASSTSTIRGNAAQLESAVVNLAVSARDALDAGGKVVIGVHDMTLSAADGRKYQLPGGAYVRVTVTNDGPGAGAQDPGHASEPFLSPNGDRGTRLGLSTVRAYAQQLGGAVSIHGVAGRGMTVTLLLPRCEESTDETMARTMPLSTLPSGNEGILLFATEEGLRSTVGQILEVLGYKVSYCGIVEEAAALLRTDQIDLLVIDGIYAEAALQLTTDSSAGGRFKIVQLVSGGGETTASATKTLTKPFSLADLAQTVRAALDAG